MIQTLVSVPPQLDAWLRSSNAPPPAVFGRLADYIGSDPAGTRLGSGGGTVSLLHQGWDQSSGQHSLEEWLGLRQTLVLHAGGESRRLPAYASVGKALLPIASAATVVDPSCRFDQVLADFQLPAYRQVLREAGDKSALLVASGDVWLELDPFQIPRVRADVCGIGMRVAPEVAQHFGVFFVPKKGAAIIGNGPREQSIAFFLQKPSPAEIYRHAARYDYFVDTGLWLFSTDAVQFLFRRCGWNSRGQMFATKTGTPAPLDLYTEVGAALGEHANADPVLKRLGWHTLSRSVIPLDDARFFHVGSSRQLLESHEQLGGARHPSRTFSFATPADAIANRSNLPAWVDGAGAAASWSLDGLNIVSGHAPGAAPIALRQEQCLELAPVGKGRHVVRPYLLDDRYRGTAATGGTICGQPAAAWLTRRGFEVTNADVFDTPVYPVLNGAEISQPLIDWFFATEPDPAISKRVRAADRLAASGIPGAVNFDRYFADRATGHTDVLLSLFQACVTTGDSRVFAQDFGAVAEHARGDARLKGWLLKNGPALLRQAAEPVHQSRLLMLLGELSQGERRDTLAQRARATLQQGVISTDPARKSRPKLALKEDQIVWGRSPVRLDLAGGWTDTPPYCLEHGGAVLNVAVLLNGQPPIQVFVRPLREPVLSLKSIDLGSAEVITTYSALATFRDPRSGFSLPKAALAMAGFLPEFNAERPVATLRDRLKRFGGGLEISLLSAVPKGSGLGTSSILAATILGALNRACRLGWDEISLYNRVLAVEQLLTTGGGWQDQAGALFRGLKLVETVRGAAQTPSVRYLPQHLFDPAHANRTMFLYYTGITRLAKGILQEIVDDMFLGRFETLQTLALIRANALALFKAVQQSEPAAVHRCIARSWDLNKRLDPGTTTPEIDRILAQTGPDLAAAKLLGAGGGGYMLLCAPDADAGQRIRERLERQPPNPRARFIDFEIADSGLEVTVS